MAIWHLLNVTKVKIILHVFKQCPDVITRMGNIKKSKKHSVFFW